MILDRLENAALYQPLGERIALALDYLGRTDFSRIPDGRYELDGDRVYAVVQRYRPKPPAEARWDAHRQYIDVQFMAEGVERIGYAPLGKALPVAQAYDSQRDFALYAAQGDFFTVRVGDFAIFYPTDVHAPSVAGEPPVATIDVCKVVIKCCVE